MLLPNLSVSMHAGSSLHLFGVSVFFVVCCACRIVCYSLRVCMVSGAQRANKHTSTPTHPHKAVCVHLMCVVVVVCFLVLVNICVFRLRCANALFGCVSFGSDRRPISTAVFAAAAATTTVPHAAAAVGAKRGRAVRQRASGPLDAWQSAGATAGTDRGDRQRGELGGTGKRLFFCCCCCMSTISSHLPLRLGCRDDVPFFFCVDFIARFDE